MIGLDPCQTWIRCHIYNTVYTQSRQNRSIRLSTIQCLSAAPCGEANPSSIIIRPVFGWAPPTISHTLVWNQVEYIFPAGCIEDEYISPSSTKLGGKVAFLHANSRGAKYWFCVLGYLSTLSIWYFTILYSGLSTLSECEEYIRIFECSNIFVTNIYLDISSYWFDMNIFRSSFVLFSWYQYIRIFIRIKTFSGRVWQKFEYSCYFRYGYSFV